MVALLLGGGMAIALFRRDWLTAWINSIVAPDHKMFWHLARERLCGPGAAVDVDSVGLDDHK